MIIEISTITVSRCWDLTMVSFQEIRKLANLFNIRSKSSEVPNGILTLMATIAMLGLIERHTKVDCNTSSNGLLKMLSSLATAFVREHEIISAVEKVVQICFDFLRKTDEILDHR